MADVQDQSQQFANITINDLIYVQVKDLDKRMDRLENRMDKLDVRMDKFDDKIDKLADKIDALRNEIIFSKNRDTVMTVAVVVIALTVIYAVFIKWQQNLFVPLEFNVANVDGRALFNAAGFK